MSLVTLTLRMVFGLGVVVFLLWALSRLAARGRKVGGRSPLKVLGRQTLAKGATVSLVQVAGRVLVVGTTSGSVNLLTELTEDEFSAFEKGDEVTNLQGPPPFGGAGMLLRSARQTDGPAWMAELVERMRDRTVRRG